MTVLVLEGTVIRMTTVLPHEQSVATIWTIQKQIPRKSDYSKSKFDHLDELQVLNKATIIRDRTTKVNNSSECQLLPDILIIGFEKCGTMTLRTYLGSHPKIYITNTNLSIPYFNSHNFQSIEKFTRNMSCTPDGKLRLEKISTYGIARKAYKAVPNIKLIAMFREPVERALSHHIHRIARKKEPVEDFDVRIKSLMDENKPKGFASVLFRQSIFVDRLQQWLETYGLNNIYFVDGDKFIEDPASELHKLEKFLGISTYFSKDHFVYNPDKKFYCLRVQGNMTNGCMSKDKGRPHPLMSNLTRIRLQQYFKPFNEKLFTAIGRNFSWNY